MLGSISGCGPDYSDQVEEKIACHAGRAPVLGLAQGAVLLAPAQDAFDPFAPRLRLAGTRDCGET